MATTVTTRKKIAGELVAGGRAVFQVGIGAGLGCGMWAVMFGAPSDATFGLALVPIKIACGGFVAIILGLVLGV